ncbi:uncharacterized protein TNCV_470701 [Trichonephila clavipes]|nr:uncharacterized protein TNCV_470701 [Trichonephila clavipes]
MIRWALKLSEFNIEWELRPGVQNVVADVLSRNPIGNLDGSQISCAALRALALNSREQREDPELGHIYNYLENPDDGSINATVCEVNIGQGRVYHPRQSDTISFDSNDEILYELQGFSDGSSRSYPGISRSSRRPSDAESKGRRSNKGTAGLEDLRLKRKVRSNGIVERKGIKRTVPSSVASRNHKYRRNNNPSQGPESIAGPSHQQMIRQFNPPTEESRRGARVQYDKARETRTTRSKGHSATEGRPVGSRQTTTVRPCPYYLRSRIKEPEGIPEEHWDRLSTTEQPQEKEPQHGSLR